MNQYAQALAELQTQPDHELKQIGDQWQTPKALAWGLFHQFAPTLGPVVLDMFADDCNALVPNYYDAEDNALTQDLAADLRRLGGAAFGNPPYSRPCFDSDGNPITGMEAILKFCREQRAQGAKIMLLIKAATSETWWPEDADFIQFISGRIGFEVPSWYVPRDAKKDKPSASGFASAVVIFDASWQGERRPEARLRRDDLITTGQIILDMIHRQAVELTLTAEQVIQHTSDRTEPEVIQDQPAVPEPAAWEPPVASDDATNAAAAHDEQADQTIDKPLDDWAFDYRNDQLNLGGASWPRFVAVLTVLNGIRDVYSPREVAIAISVSDEELMDEYTTLTEETKVLLRNAVSALEVIEGYDLAKKVGMADHHRQAAVEALVSALREDPNMPPMFQRSKMIGAINNVSEEAA